jgi:hypothetical protein
MKVKIKPCKAIGKARGSDVQGCAKGVLKRTYGLCDKCYRTWLFETPEGKEKQNQNLPKCNECNEAFTPYNNNSLQKFCMQKQKCITAHIEHQKEEEIKKAEREKHRHKAETMSKDQFRAVKIQPLINLLARIIDKDQPCIATGNHEGKMAGGHRHSVNDSRNISLNLHNIHVQSYHSNDKKAGDHVKYRAGLIKIYGRAYANFIDEELMQCPGKLWNKDELVELRPMLKKIVNYYKGLNKVYSSSERIELRNKLNVELGMYPEEYAVFK